LDDDDFADFWDADSEGVITALMPALGEEITSGPIETAPCVTTVTKVSRTTSWRPPLGTENLQPHKGELLVRVLAADGKLTVDNLSHTDGVSIAPSTSAEADFAREKCIPPLVCTHSFRFGSRFIS
jgi:hypothetical protein